MSGHNSTMSLEAALDEERLAIMEILERQAGNKKPAAPPRRSDSPAETRSPIRSMLDVGDDAANSRKGSSPPPAVRYRSMLDVEPGPARGQKPVRSMLDEASGATPPPGGHSAKSSVSDAPSAAGSARSTGDLSVTRPDAPMRHTSPGRDPLAGYQFSDIITSQIGQSLPMPKRNQVSGRNSATSPLAQTRAAPPPPTVELPRHSISGPVVRRGRQSLSVSPHGRRSSAASAAAAASPQPAAQPEKSNKRVMTLDSGHSLNLDKAYKNLSNASLMASAGPLSSLAYQRAQGQAEGEGRLEKAYLGPDGEGLYTSSEDEGDLGDEGDDEDGRGRDTAPRLINSSASSDASAPGTLLAAADDERKNVSTTYKVRSLFDFEDEEKRKLAAYQEAHPVSTVNSANNSENEVERDEIKTAQRMPVQLTHVFSDSDVDRSVQVIYRGDFSRVAGAAVEEHKTLRKYLVATDMSEHSAHALEWAVGTVMRDGDTLVVVRCLDAESDDGGGGGAAAGQGQGRSSSISALASALGSGGSTGGDSASASSGPDRLEGIGADRREGERRAVVDDLTARVSRLLRRTKLQVRVIIEVIHCRNPKHLVLEMIDFIKPTLVILGSRGRSAIKGVILGSFSNYLVTKSSVPVMVARKRLRKKARRGPERQVNNLSNPAGRSLARARID